MIQPGETPGGSPRSGAAVQSGNDACPCCGRCGFYEVVVFPAVPVSGVYRSGAHEPLPEIDLAFEACEACGVLRRRAFAAAIDYATKHRSTRGQLPVYRERLLQTIAESVRSPHDLVVEIGSNDGTFLELLRERGYSNLVGIEPADALAESACRKELRTECGYFDRDMAQRVLELYGKPTVAVCRHTLEHVPHPAAFMAAIRDLVIPGSGSALIEVPDSRVIYERLNFVELWDEHVYYFTPATLGLLLERTGLHLRSCVTMGHLETRNIVVCASADEPRGRVHGAPASSEGADWKAFAGRLRRFASSVRDVIAGAPKPVYLIGASHPQCNFMNFLRLDSMVDCMIDDDPGKLGKLPPVRGRPVRIIDSAQFASRPEGGTLVLTGFGYPAWTARMAAAAAARHMRIVDPRDFVR